MAGVPATDVHQHLWPEPFVAALARRDRLPRVRGATVELAGEPASSLPPGAGDPAARATELRHDGVDRALLALSSPLGIEALGPDEARPLLDTWHDAVLGLGPAFGAWGALALGDAGPAEAVALLDRGAVGLSLPAGALASPERLESRGAVLEALERRGAPLLVHPGPGPEDHGASAAADDAAVWWAPLTGYVASLQAAWLAWAGWGRAAHPRLRVVFAALAGLAPLHAERLAARGGPARAVHDPFVFYDTSSYGHRAVDAMVRVVGIDALVHGTDRPVVGAPPHHGLGAAADRALKVTNVGRLLDGAPA